MTIKKNASEEKKYLFAFGYVTCNAEFLQRILFR